ncbi:hypothetical protein [Leptothermofonsia sp. ETS-13]|uniref:hypothetical protein n=1 Tax=Leptothermofonsia sp. ETS-13 TaxID=3035696 RepID=UPI003B9DED70
MGSFTAEIGIALKQAVLATFPPVTHAGKQQVKAESPEAAALPAFSVQVPKVQIVMLADLEKQRSSIVASLDNLIIYPLTLNAPDWLPFPGQGVYYQCRDIGRLRSQVEEWDYGTGSGNLWLAIALTAKGPPLR